jgi:hypothetical protein
MAKQGYRISKEIKDEILNKITNNGLGVIDAAKQYGISDKTIYNWLGTKAKGVPFLGYLPACPPSHNMSRSERPFLLFHHPLRLWREKIWS